MAASKRPLGIYLLYMVLCFFFHSVLISLVAFFHFQLGHHFNIIEDWVFKNCWRLNLISKGLAFFFTVRLGTFDIYRGQLLRGLLYERFQRPAPQFFVFMIFLLAFTTVPLHPQYSPGRAELIFQIVSFIGVVLFYFLDFLILSFALYLHPMKNKETRWGLLVLAPVLFYFLNKWSFPYQRNFHFFVYLQMLVILWLGLGRNADISGPLFYCLFVIAPLSSFFGLDPILGNLYSPFVLTKPPSVLFLMTVWGIGVTYIYMTPKKNHDIIELGQAET